MCNREIRKDGRAFDDHGVLDIRPRVIIFRVHLVLVTTRATYLVALRTACVLGERINIFERTKRMMRR